MQGLAKVILRACQPEMCSDSQAADPSLPYYRNCTHTRLHAQARRNAVREGGASCQPYL